MVEAHPNFTKILNEICEEENITLQSFSGNWAFRLKKNGIVKWIVGYQFPLNSAPAKELCQDKVLTSDALTAYGIPNVSHEILFGAEVRKPELRPETEKKLQKMISRFGAVVLKDNYGTGGMKVFKSSEVAECMEILEKILDGSHAASLSPFLNIREEYRVSVLNGEPMQIIRKERAFEINERGEKVYLNWRHNLGQGATGILVTDEAVTKPLIEMALKVTEVLGIQFASVDIVDADGKLQVLEVNGGVMMEYFAGQSKECYNRAKAIYKKAVLSSFEE